MGAGRYGGFQNVYSNPTEDRESGTTVWDLTSVFGEANGKRRLLNFLLEQVFFVEEKNDGRVGEPLVVADTIEQLQTLLHPVLEQKNENREKKQT